MATVYKKKKTAKSWYIGFKDETGGMRYQKTAAGTKSEAWTMALERERSAERLRMGLEATPGTSSMTLGELCTWWLENRCPPARAQAERYRLQRHVLSTKWSTSRSS